MKLSKFIENLKEILEKEGDKNIFMLVDSGEDTQYAVSVPEEIEYDHIQDKNDCEDWDLALECVDGILIKNLSSFSFDEDEVGLHFDGEDSDED
jgi:hypothetical protein